MKRDHRIFVRDIVDSIGKIEEFTRGKSYDDFTEDDMLSSAVVRKLEIIGEASKNIPESVKGKHKGVPWKEMARIRDKLIHWYFGIDYEIVWKVVKEELPQIKPMIEGMLKKE